MAYLYKAVDSSNWSVGWSVDGKKFRRTTGTSDRTQAEKQLKEIQELEDSASQLLIDELVGDRVEPMLVRAGGNDHSPLLAFIARRLRPFGFRTGEGIYFLRLRSKLQYIGTSANLASRSASHVGRIEFDEVNVFEIKSNNSHHAEWVRLVAEAVLINMLKPPMNRMRPRGIFPKRLASQISRALLKELKACQEDDASNYEQRPLWRIYRDFNWDVARRLPDRTKPCAERDALSTSCDLEKFLGLGSRAIDKLIIAGLPFVQFNGEMRFDMAQVKEWVKSEYGVNDGQHL